MFTAVPISPVPALNGLPTCQTVHDLPSSVESIWIRRLEQVHQRNEALALSSATVHASILVSTFYSLPVPIPVLAQKQTCTQQPPKPRSDVNISDNTRDSSLVQTCKKPKTYNFGDRTREYIIISGCAKSPNGNILLTNYTGVSAVVVEYSVTGQHIKNIAISEPPFDATALDTDRIAVTYGDWCQYTEIKAFPKNENKKIHFQKSYCRICQWNLKFYVLIHGSGVAVLISWVKNCRPSSWLLQKRLICPLQRIEYCTQTIVKVQYNVTIWKKRNCGNSRIRLSRDQHDYQSTIIKTFLLQVTTNTIFQLFSTIENQAKHC
ncbi:unnamed protein product [Mytilus edulis]|uniref:Uncharacterized protein n=1 Tax=Mytilus edulis TaxID=6550 RepID=A0A8S3QDM1_MYTED|nr:unnamed protein product [Mytilus edulis]